VTWLLEHSDFDVETLTAALEHQSGQRSPSGTSSGLCEVLIGRARGDKDCALAFDVSVHTLVREIGAMAASAGGLDVLVFTGGVGEHSPQLRAAAAERLGHLGVVFDAEANDAAQSDAIISVEGSAAATVIVTAAEDVEIARLVRGILCSGF
jgi:acetate kinase